MAKIAEYIFDAKNNILPIFNDGFKYEYTDVNNEDGTITRTIFNETIFPTSISFKGMTDLIEINYIDTTNIDDMSDMFRNCPDLVMVDLSNVDVTHVAKFNSMFYNSKKLSIIDMRGLSVEVVNKFLDVLPNRTEKNQGIVLVDSVGLYNSKPYWNIVTGHIIAKYKGIDGVPCDPEFDEEFEHNIIPLYKDGNYIVKVVISNQRPTKMNFKNKTGLVELLQIDATGIRDLNNLFCNCINLTKVNLVGANASGLTTAYNMFYGCENLTRVDLKSFFVKTEYRIISLRNMFSGCARLTEVKNFPTFEKQVDDMGNMFKGCVCLTKVDMGGLTCVNDCYGMFDGCVNLTEIKNLSVRVTNAANMFRNCSSLVELDVKYGRMQLYDNSVIEGMFDGCENLERVLAYNCDMYTINKLIDALPTLPEVNYNNKIYLLCYGNTEDTDININIANNKNWNTHKFYIMDYDYNPNYGTDTIPFVNQLTNSNLTLFTVDYDTFNGRRIMCADNLLSGDITMGGYAKHAVTRINFIDLSEVGNAYCAFGYCANLTYINFNNCGFKGTRCGSLVADSTRLTTVEGLSSFDTSNVTDMSNMFKKCSSLTSLDVSSFVTSNVTDMHHMFSDCSNLTSLDLSNFDTSNVTDMSWMFYECNNLTSLDVSSFDTSKVTNMYGMFAGCNNLTSLDLNNFNTSSVTNMSYMFSGCNNLTSLDVSNFDTSKVADMSYMFNNCYELTTLDLSNFNTSKVTNMSYMFARNTNIRAGMKLTNIKGLNKFDTSDVTDMSYMFFRCTKLTSIDVNNWVIKQGVNLESTFKDCSSLTTLDLSKWNVNTSNVKGMFESCSKLTDLKLGEWFRNDRSNFMNYMFAYCSKITTLDLSGWRLGYNSQYVIFYANSLEKLILRDCTFGINNAGEMLYQANKLRFIDARGPKGDVSKMILQIPDRTDFEGGDCILLTDSESVITEYSERLTARNWKILTHVIAEYEFTSTIDTLPTFNEGYEYSYIDEVNETTGITKRTIYGYGLPTIIKFFECSGLVSLNYIDIGGLTSTEDLFYKCTNLTSVDLSNLDTSNITNMSGMFYYCNNLTTLDLSNFNTGKVTDMSYMFTNCTNLTSLDLSSFDTSIVTNMYQMIRNCTNLTTLDLSNFDTSKVTNIKSILDGSINISLVKMINSDVTTINNVITQLNARTENSPGFLMIGENEISAVDTTTASSKYWNITNYLIAKYTFNSSTDTLPTFNSGYTYTYTDVDNGDNTITRTIISDTLPTSISFSGKTGLVSLEYLNTSNVTNMNNMFYGCNNLKLIDLSSFDTSQVTSMKYMFNTCSSLTSLDGSSFDTSNVTDMEGMFYDCNNLTSLDVSNFDTSKVNNMRVMFNNCSSLTSLDVSSFDTSNVTRMDRMFNNCNKLTSLNVSNFDTSNVIYMNRMFYNCSNLTTLDLSNFDTSNVTDMYEMFYQCTNLSSLDVSNFDTSKVTDMNNVFNGCSNLTSLYLSNFDTSKVTDMSYMFRGCASLTSLNVSSFDTSKVTTMKCMFTSCNKLTSLDVSNFNTSKVTDMEYMFNTCSSLTSLDLSNFDTSKITSTYRMFWNCTNLLSIDLSSFNTSKVTDMSGMFNGCSSLRSLDLSSFNTSKVTDMSVMLNGCSSLTSLDLSNFDTSKITYIDDMFYGCTALSSIRLIGCDVDTINDVITNLPTLTNMYGTLRIGTLDKSTIDLDTAHNKNWFVYVNKIADYNFTTSADTLPGFNVGYEYKSFDVVDSGAGTTNRVIVSEDLPTSIRFNDKTGLVSLSYLDIGNVTNMVGMFNGCTNLTTLDVSNCDTSNVTNMSKIFYGCSSIASLDLSNWDTGNVTNMDSTFSKSGLTTLDLSNWNTDKVTNMNDMFWSCSKLTTLNITGWFLKNDIYRMFSGCSKLANLIGIESCKVRNVTYCDYMFANCSSLTSLDLSGWSCAPYRLGGMFKNCSNLTTLNISGIQVRDVTDIGYTFGGCTNLTTIIGLENWNTSATKNMCQLFSGCKALKTLDLSGWDFNAMEHIINYYIEFDNNLQTIIMNNNDVNSINTVIKYLPTRTTVGRIYVTGVEDITSIDKVTALSKKWKIIIKENRTNNVLPIYLANKLIRARYTDNTKLL